MVEIKSFEELKSAAKAEADDFSGISDARSCLFFSSFGISQAVFLPMIFLNAALIGQPEHESILDQVYNPCPYCSGTGLVKSRSNPSLKIIISGDKAASYGQVIAVGRRTRRNNGGGFQSVV